MRQVGVLQKARRQFEGKLLPARITLPLYPLLVIAEELPAGSLMNDMTASDSLSLAILTFSVERAGRLKRCPVLPEERERKKQLL